MLTSNDVSRTVQAASAAGRTVALLARPGVAEQDGARDIDIVVSPKDVSAVASQIAAQVSGDGFVLFNRVLNDYSEQLYYYRPHDLKVLHVDLMPRLTYRGIPFMELPIAGDQVSSDGIPKVADAWSVAHALLRNTLWRGRPDHRYQSAADAVMQDSLWASVVSKAFDNAFGSGYGSNILKRVIAGNSIHHGGAVCRFLWRSVTRRPFRTMIGIARHAYYLTRRFFRYPGIMIVILGPDGSGKSSVISRVAEELSATTKVSRFHLFPGFLPHNRSAARANTPVTNPHENVNRGFWVSSLKLISWIAEYGLGWTFIIWKRLVEGHVVAFDRYYHDILIDSKRYRYGGPRWLARMVRHFVPRPDLWLLLDAEPLVLHSRKQEVPIEEIGRQRTAYRALIADNEGIVIDASKPLEDVVKGVTREIFLALERRTGDRAFQLHRCAPASADHSA